MSKNAWGRTSRFVYIGGLSHFTKEEDIKTVFCKFGHIRDIILKKGFCFLEFENCEDADKACYKMNNGHLLKNRVQVEIAWGSPRGRDRQRSVNLSTLSQNCSNIKKI